MRMTASWFGSLDLPHTRLRRDSIAPESGLPSDCHPNCIIVLEAARMRMARSNQETESGKNVSPCLTQKAPYKGPCADSVEKHEPASDVATVVVDSLKALDPTRPIREADSCSAANLRPLLLQEIANFRQQLAWARTAPISRSTASHCGITTTFRNDTITKCTLRDGIVSASPIRCRKHQCITDRYLRSRRSAV